MPLTALSPTHKGNWEPGQSGNPKGRPPGARQVLSENFIRDLAADYAKHGVDAIERVRQQSPDKYLGLIVKLIPRQIETPDHDNPFTEILKRMSS